MQGGSDVGADSASSQYGDLPWSDETLPRGTARRPDAAWQIRRARRVLTVADTANDGAVAGVTVQHLPGDVAPEGHPGETTIG